MKTIKEFYYKGIKMDGRYDDEAKNAEDFIDLLSNIELQQLVSTYWHGGTIQLWWINIPFRFLNILGIEIINGKYRDYDYWSIINYSVNSVIEEENLEIINGKYRDYDYWSIINYSVNSVIEEENLEKINQEEEDIPRIILFSSRYNVLKRQKWKCNSCATHLKYSKNHELGTSVAHIDHIYPYSKRWTYPFGIKKINEENNLQALCESCNKIKYNKKND